MIYTSHFPAVKRFSKDGIFASMFNKNTRKSWEDVALVDAATGQTTTYRQLHSLSLRFADGLSKELKEGETFCIFSPNSQLYPAILLGSIAAGLVATTSNPSYTSHEMAFQLTDSGAKIIITTSDLVNVAKEAMKMAGLPNGRIFVLPGVNGALNLGGERSYKELMRSETFVPRVIEKPDSTVAYLPYSSGTTGRPKGVQVSHTQVENMCQQIHNVPCFTTKETFIAVLPLYHMYGLMLLMHGTLYSGGKLVLLVKFEMLPFCQAIQDHKVTYGAIVPPIGLGLTQHPQVKNYDLSSVKLWLTGAAPIATETCKKLEKIFPGSRVHQGYGMTETTCCALLPDIENQMYGSCGKLIPNVEARLVDEDGYDVEKGERGELWLRGPNMLLAYHNNLKASLETKTTDGWLKTGDVCMRFDSGDFIIVDRYKELIKVNALQVAPAELEALILDCPLVADVGVIGVWSNEKQTEYPRAYVVPSPSHTSDSDLQAQVVAFVAKHAAPHKRLGAGVRIVNAIPKNPSGKILRKDLRAMAAKEQEKSKL